MDAKEIELIDYIDVLWRKKWLIIGGTALLVSFVVAISFVIRPVYVIDAIIQPGKLFIQDEIGKIEEFVVESPQQIADRVNHKSLDELVRSDLNINERDFPDIHAETFVETLLTRIWISHHDVVLSKKILTSLIDHLRVDIDQKIGVERSNIAAEIERNEIEKTRRTAAIQSQEKKLGIIGQRKKDLIKELSSVEQNIKDLEKTQKTVLEKENRGEMETLGLLLYSNEIQQSLQNYELLNEKLSVERLNEVDVQTEINFERTEISKIESDIANLQERQGRIDDTKTVKQPTASVYAVFPRRSRLIPIAGCIGIFMFTLLAFFLEYLKNQRKRPGKT